MIVPLRIRKAEVALKDGRLDEAYTEAIRDDVRNHRRGQRLAGRLSQAYQDRCREHLTAGNPRAALADAERAGRLGGNQPNILTLQDEARNELNAVHSRQQARQQKLGAVRQCLANGDYSLGAQLCDEEPGDTVAGLMKDAELDRRGVEAAVERGETALRQQDLDSALDALDDATRRQPRLPAVVELRRRVATEIAKQVRAAFVKGRLDQAELLLKQIQPHSSRSLELAELSNAVAQSREAAGLVRATDLPAALEQLQSLKRVVPEARWLDQTIDAAEAAMKNLNSLRSGPLSALAQPADLARTTARPGRRGGGPPSPGLARSADHARPERAPIGSGGAIPTNFAVHLDGTGSVLVMRGTQATVGPASHSRPVDVALQGQTGIPTLTVERLDDDYFLTSAEPVRINGTKTTSKLLASQDQIRVGRRGSMHFALPNAASTTATLDFSGIRPVRGNARRVILMDDALVIGPQPSAHIQSLSLERAMVIHARDGQLRIRPLSRTPDEAGVTLQLNQPHDLDGLSLVVTEIADYA